jgi:hypothetical protein
VAQERWCNDGNVCWLKSPVVAAVTDPQRLYSPRAHDSMHLQCCLQDQPAGILQARLSPKFRALAPPQRVTVTGCVDGTAAVRKRSQSDALSLRLSKTWRRRCSNALHASACALIPTGAVTIQLDCYACSVVIRSPWRLALAVARTLADRLCTVRPSTGIFTDAHWLQ